MKNLVTIILISLTFFNCTDEDIYVKPVLIEGMFYSYKDGVVNRAKKQVSYHFEDNQITVKDGAFLIFRGDYTITDGTLIATATSKNMVYDFGDAIEFNISVGKYGKYIKISKSWLWFVSSSDVTGTYKHIYSNLNE